ncbi:glycosyltransferase family 2 protein [Trinickia sp. EG282A]|uniref:glycosyltransferase family 2 protein n=1 Tax=Trinickia sp. EG282A TaxID=3237013 RepID=UPI0034D25370
MTRTYCSSQTEASESLCADNRGLTVSLVVYRPDVQLLETTLSSLGKAYDRLRDTRDEVPAQLYIVDNGGLQGVDIGSSLELLAKQGIAHQVLSGHGNIGYGRGHNLAIERATSGYHVVLNPDIDMDADALVNALDFLDAHCEVGLVTPRIQDDQQAIQYLCRRYPTVLDLFVRGFLPGAIRRWFAGRLGRYEMRDVINDRDVVWDPPIASGCFMIFRTNVLKRLSGFDPRYFLYFEDYDLSLRAHELARVAYVPAVRAVHHGGGAARKGSAHIRMFVSSAFKFYNRFGWKWV